MRKIRMELGRSMVEMLGVLAIVGVLSIVGLAGYKKAMIKIHANEIMDMAMKIYNENLAYATMFPDVTATNGSLCSNTVTADPGYSSTVIGYCNRRNMGMEKPKWADQEAFGIRSTVLGGSTYHEMRIMGLGSCDVCEELRSVTEKVAGQNYRLLLNSATPDLPGGLRIWCRHLVADTTANNCWSKNDTE